MAYYKPEELENIRKGLEWAKKNPSDPKSIEIQNRLKSGQLNFELKALGLKEVPVQVPKIVMPKIPEAGQMSIPKPTLGESLKETGNDLLQTAQNIGGTISEGAQNIQNIAGNKDLNIAQKSMGILGSLMGTGAKTIGDVTTGVGKAVLSQDAEDQLKSFVQEKAQGIADTEIVKKAVNWYENLTPENKLIVDSAGGFASLVTELAGAGVAGKASVPLKEGVKTAVDVAETGIKKAAQAVDTFAESTKVSRIASQEAKVDDAVARIIQGTPEDIAKAKKALMEVDTQGIKTYSELNEVLDSNIESLVKKQDSELAKYTEVYPKEQLGRYKEVKGIDGKMTTVTDSPIVDALDQLNAYYTKTGDVSKSTIVKQYIDKLNSTGLTVDEMNKIARMHGVDLNAYNANGELASGLTKQAAENTRQGVKETLRQRLPDEVSKGIDESLSNLYSTRALTQDMETKVQKLYQKVKNRTLAQKVGGAVADVVDLASFGTLRGFVQKLLPSNVGLKTANSLDLEKELSKNLAQIDKLLAIKDEKKFTEAMAKYLEEVQPGLSIRVASGLDNGEKDVLLGKLQTVSSQDVMKGNEVDLELFDRLESLKSKAEKAGGLTEREYAELKALMDEVELNTNQTIAPSFKQGEIPTTKGAPLADTSGGFEGQYLYHGTSEQLLDSIAKDGLKPGMRGQLSLSKDEGYARSYAEGSKFPAKEGQGVVFRINADLLKGKTTTKRLDGKERPLPDQKNELLTNETIPPEAIEILKDGKWKPLVEPNPLYTEARGKSLEEFVKTQGKPVYHATSADFIEFDINKANTGHGSAKAIFVSETPGSTKYYQRGDKARVIEATISPDAKIFDYKTDKNIIEDFLQSVPEKPSADAISRGFTESPRAIKREVLTSGNWGAIEGNEFQDFLKKKGYDGFHVMDMTGHDAVGITNPSKIKTRSQLTDIWKKANGQK